jgi:hypothetical protein
MTFCKEFVDWTGNKVEWDFQIKEVSHNLKPGNSVDIKCDGLGFIGLYKDSDGMLMLKFEADNPEGYVLSPFFVVKSQYVKD